MPRSIDQFIESNLLKADPRRVDAQGFVMDGPRDEMSIGFGHNFAASVGEMVDEHTTLSEFWAGWGAQNIPGTVGHEVFGGRNSELERMAQNGDIPESVWEHFQYTGAFHAGPRGGIGTNWNGLAKYAKERGYDIKTNDELKENVRDTLKHRRDYVDRVRQKSGFAGDIGMLLGTFAGAALDPINVAASMYGGATAVRGATALRNMFRMGGREAMINIGAESLIQPLVMSFKERIGSPYGAADALTEIAAAGVFGFGLGSVMSIPSGIQIRRLNAEARDIRENGASVVEVRDTLGAMVGSVRQWDDGTATLTTVRPIRGYHGTDSPAPKFDPRDGLGVHVAMDPSVATLYPSPGPHAGARVVDSEIAPGKFLIVQDLGTSHSQAQQVIEQLVEAGHLPEKFRTQLEGKIRDDLDGMYENLQADVLLNKPGNLARITKALDEKRIDEDQFEGLMSGDILDESGDVFDIVSKNNYAALTEVREYLRGEGYAGLAYQGTRDGAGEGQSLVVFDSKTISAQRELTREEARGMDASIDDISQYLDELARSPAETIHEHEGGIKGAEDVLNDTAPVRQPDEPEIKDTGLPSAEEIKTDFDAHVAQNPDQPTILGLSDEPFMQRILPMNDVDSQGRPIGRYTMGEVKRAFDEYETKLNSVIKCLEGEVAVAGVSVAAAGVVAARTGGVVRAAAKKATTAARKTERIAKTIKGQVEEAGAKVTTRAKKAIISPVTPKE